MTDDLRHMGQIVDLAYLAGMEFDLGRQDTEVLTMLASWCGAERTRELILAREVFTRPLPMETCNHPHLRALRRA